MYEGAYLRAIYLQRSRKEVKELSAMIIGAFPYLKAVAAPILLPQIITLKPFFQSYLTTEET